MTIFVSDILMTLTKFCFIFLIIRFANLVFFMVSYKILSGNLLFL